MNGHVMKDPIRDRRSGLVFERATIELWIETRSVYVCMYACMYVHVCTVYVYKWIQSMIREMRVCYVHTYFNTVCLFEYVCVYVCMCVCIYTRGLVCPITHEPLEKSDLQPDLDLKNK